MSESDWVDARETPVKVYDPGLGSIAACKSAVTYLDGENGVLLYRGYPIEDLAGRVSFLSVAYLVLHGELPTTDELATFTTEIDEAAAACPRELMDTLPLLLRDATPMAFLHAAASALAAYDSSTRRSGDAEAYKRTATKLLGALPLLAAAHGRARIGEERIRDLDGLGFTERFLTARFGETNPIFTEAMDLLFVLHADHEQNCSTTAARVTASSQADVYHTVASAIGALAGPLHGGANEEVLIQLEEIGDVSRVEEAVKLAKSGERRLMGFGHRVYKNYDPRARIIQKAAHQVFEKVGRHDPLLDVAVALEQAALSDPYFVERKLYPNVDFYSGLIYRALGFDSSEFTVLFALGRSIGWVTHGSEQLADKEQRIIRPRQIYIGSARRELQ